MFKPLAALLVIVFGLCAVPCAHAASLCAASPTSDALFPLPARFVPAAIKAFDLHDVTAQDVQTLTVARCMGGHVYACFVGANLPCDKADLSTYQPAISAWCKTNPQSDFVPAFITGHESAYTWRCTNGQASITPPTEALDAQGFFKAYWRQVQP